MKTIISLTSIPSRFKSLPHIVQDLLDHQKSVDEIWVNIPTNYNRFPDTPVIVPPELLINTDNRVIINRCETDYGPGTMYFGPIVAGTDADTIIVVNDDTKYPDNLSSELIKKLHTDDAVWCLSGFNIDEYIKGSGRVNYKPDGEVDVTESYGGVILRKKWIQQVFDEYNELVKLTYNDDVILGNLFSKHGIKKKTLVSPTCNIGHIKQYQFGFSNDALFYNDGEGTHYKNNLRIFDTFKANNVYFF